MNLKHGTYLFQDFKLISKVKLSQKICVTRHKYIRFKSRKISLFLTVNYIFFFVKEARTSVEQKHTIAAKQEQNSLATEEELE